MKVCKWIFEKSMLETSYHDRLDLLCDDLGIPYQVVTYIPMAKSFGESPFLEPPKFDDGDCVVAYGSIEAVDGLSHYNKKYLPFSYIQKEKLTCKSYMPNIPQELLLNDNYIMLPYKEFLRRKDGIYSLFNTNKLFIRPDSGLKTFSGTTVHLDDFDIELKSINEFSSVKEDTIILISGIKPIEEEYRIVIGNGHVIASSLYKVRDEVVMKEGAPENVISLAEKIANLSWQPDLVYTCDIAVLSNGDVKVIELNSFSCAGLYACNLREILLKVSEIALLEYNGLIDYIH